MGKLVDVDTVVTEIDKMPTMIDEIGAKFVEKTCLKLKIKALPPAEPGWIPCSETMPEREGCYVCTYIDDGEKDVFMFRYEDGGWMVPWYVEEITAWYKPLDP